MYLLGSSFCLVYKKIKKKKTVSVFQGLLSGWADMLCFEIATAISDEHQMRKTILLEFREERTSHKCNQENLMEEVGFEWTLENEYDFRNWIREGGYFREKI